tara:strand:+ start:1082 stop:3448 length:2367 start_codon:yes stop_codon:yes gene_type:complete
MSTVKINELATSAVSLTDFFAKADANGIANKNTVQGLSNFLNSVGTLAYRGVLFSADAAVTLDGIYVAGDSGTYTNNGGLVITVSNQIVLISITGTQTVFEKVEIPITLTIDSEPTNGSTNAISSNGVFDALEKKVTESFGLNLLDLSKLNNGYLTSTGSITNSGSTVYFVSDYIPTIENRTIVCNMNSGGSTYIALYDENKAFISSVTSSVGEITGSVNAKFVRFTVFETAKSISSTMISIDEIPLEYISFNPVGGYKNNSLQYYPLANDFNLESDLLKIDDSTGRTSGIFNISNSGYQTTDYINILAQLNKNLYIQFSNALNSGFTLIEFYDEKKIVLKTIKGGSAASNTFYKLTPPQGAKFVRYTIYTSTITHGLFYGSYKNLDSYFTKNFNYTIFNQNGWWTENADGRFFDDKGAFQFRTPMRNAVGISKIEVYSRNYSAKPSLTFYDENRKTITSKTILGTNNRVINTVEITSDVYYYAITCMSESVDAGYTNNYVNEFYVNAERIESKTKSEYIHNVLWNGTSIPDASQYPSVACGNLGFSLENQAIGSSNVIWNESSANGLSLSASIAEKETFYRPSVTSGAITEATLNTYKAASYDSCLIPFINGVQDTCDVWVFDHGFNDKANIKTEIDAGGIDLDSKDRTKFIGAFNYIYDEITKVNPHLKIIIGGYFQDSVDYGGTNGSFIVQIQQMISDRYSFPIMKIWEKSGISSYFVPNSSTYISDYNTTYGTSWTPQQVDGSGNITFFQLMCPDFVHPYSDRTNKSNERLNVVYYNELKNVIS